MAIKANTTEELLALFSDPSAFKALAAELATNSDAPDISQLPSIEQFKADLAARQGTQTAGAGDIDQSQATTSGAAFGQADAQAEENNAQGFGGAAGGGGGFGGLPSAEGLDQSQKFNPADFPVQSGPGQRVGSTINAVSPQLPARRQPDIQGLIELLARAG